MIMIDPCGNGLFMMPDKMSDNTSGDAEMRLLGARERLHRRLQEAINAAMKQAEDRHRPPEGIAKDLENKTIEILKQFRQECEQK